MTDCDVVIVGGGLSGLSAAYTLNSRNKFTKFIVLEAKNRVGGRTQAVDLKTVSGIRSWDIGGQWIGTCQPHIYKLVNDLGFETYEQYCSGKKLFQLDKHHSIIQYSSDIPPISIISKLELCLFMVKIRRLVKKAQCKTFLTSKLAIDLDSCTLEQYKQCNLFTTGARNTLDACCRCIFGTDPKHMSALFFVLYVTKAGSFEAILSCHKNFGAQQLKVKGGAWQICQRLSNMLSKDSIFMETVVQSIHQRTDSDIVVHCSNNKTIRCRFVILAIPPNEIIRITFEPRLPKYMFHVFQRMPVGCLTKVIVTYSEAFWRRKGLSGEVVTSGANGTHPMCIIFDASLESQHCHALVAFVGGEQQVNFSCLKPEERKVLVLESLSTFFGPEAKAPLDYVEKDWNEEVFNGGCPVNVASPGIATMINPSLFYPFQRIFFAGTESASQWCGFMDGAVQSGQRAAKEVLCNIDPTLLSKEDLKDTCYHAGEESIVIHSYWEWKFICTLGSFIVATLLLHRLSKV